MTVYIVLDGAVDADRCPYEEWVEAVFNSKELAEAYVALLPEHSRGWYPIIERVVGEDLL